ncbi:MAG: ABC transporter permease [Bacteroidetes bacterium]|nr:ABC transporter permease [Bacteroidota bacterium]
MLKDYFKIAWRNLLKSRTSSFINISGLAVGIAVAILTGLWLYDELSFNTYHDNYDRIAKVVIKGTDPQRGGFMSPVLSYPLVLELKEKYKEDFQRMTVASWTSSKVLSFGDKNLSCDGQYMDKDAPDLFGLKMVWGTRAGLTDMRSILLARSVARSLFGDSDPTGKTIKLAGESVTVTGVYEDLPLNTDLTKVRFISTFDLWVSESDWTKRTSTEWFNHYLRMFVEIKPSTTFAAVDRRIKDVEMNNIRHSEDANTKHERAVNPEVVLYPMAKWHLEAADKFRKDSEMAPGRLVWLVSLIGAFVLVLACINFMNLSTARSERRAREVGIRKAVGSLRRQLITQFFGESLLLVVVAFGIALLLASLVLGWFNQLAAKQMSIPWANPWFWGVSLVFIVVTGIIAGSYPALYLSSFNPVKALKGNTRLGRDSVLPRKVLVVLQFTISVALINCTIIILQQVQHAKDRPVGYDREGLLTVNMQSPEYYTRRDLIRSELLKTGVVLEAAQSMGRVTELASNNGGFSWAGYDPNKDQNYGTIAVSPEYGRTVGWQFVMGRDFNRDSPLDSAGMVINESALREMGLKDPIGTDVTWTWWMDKTQVMHYKIIGVVKDMIVESPYAPTKATVYYQKGLNGGYSSMEIKVRPGVAMSRALPKIAAVMKQLVPSAPFDYRFVDEDYAQKFAQEDRMSKLSSFFAGLAIFISCLGLFGLASFTAEQRTREVGIRKVLGASVGGVWRLLSKEFVILVGVALLVAMPVAWYIMSRWLTNYNYRVAISVWVFVGSGAGALLISLATVSWQAVRAAVANPVKSLRTE